MADESKIPEIQKIVSAYPFKKGTTLSHTSLNQICEGLSNVTDGIDTKQDAISDLEAIRSGAALGATAVQPSALTDYYTKNETDGELDKKQDVISDLETIRSGATLGATAIQPEVLQQQLSNYLTETEVNELIAEINSFEVEFVDVLPDSGKTHTIYFVPASDGVESDFYNEYMYINGNMELIGNTRIDLSGYYTSTQTDNLLATKQNTLVAGTNIEISGDTISSKVYEASEFDIKDLADSEGLRTKWDNKQDAITDLDEIRSGAALGATAVQDSDLQTALSGYYTSGKTDELLAAKQDVIEDLDDIRSGAALGATALQSDALIPYFTSAQTMELIGDIDHFAVKVVDTLPVSGEPNTIYFVNAEGGDPTDAKNEYIYVEGTGWELIGTTRIDLTDYYTSGKTDELLATKQNTINDLETIRSGAALGETAIQESDLQTALSGYYTSGVTDELLDAKQDVLTAGSHIEISGDTISVVGLSDVLYTEITYSELVSLRGTSGLTPGMQYRITDYVTTVNPSLTDVQSAGHIFDIIVEATDVDKLSENAKAIQSVRDTDGYFAEVNLDAWELKYCLDNDTDKYAWADSTDGKGVIYWLKDEWNNECPYDFKNIQFKRIAITNIEATGLTSDMLSDLQTTLVYDNNGGICYGQVNGVPSNVSNNGSTINYTFDDSIESWYYTFTWIDENNDVKDASIVGQTLTNDEGQYSGVFNNQILPVSQYMFYPESPTEFGYSLNNIVFVSSYSFEDGTFYGYYGNKFGVNCYNNTFGNSCWGNTFGNNCNNNTFGNSCWGNTFGNYCYNNTFGNGCESNTFGNYFQYNTFGNNCGSNTFGNNCNNNTFGNYFQYNTFGNGCYQNTFGNYCDSNTFGNNCNNNTFGNYCYNNTFGNECYYNTFGNYCNNNTFGNYFQYNTFGNGYIKECRFGDGVQYCTISGYEDLDNYGNGYYIRNIVVLNGTKGSYNQLLELNENEIFNTHNFKQDDLAPQIVCGFFINENDVMTYIAKYYFTATLG